MHLAQHADPVDLAAIYASDDAEQAVKFSRALVAMDWTGRTSVLKLHPPINVVGHFVHLDRERDNAEVVRYAFEMVRYAVGIDAWSPEKLHLLVNPVVELLFWRHELEYTITVASTVAVTRDMRAEYVIPSNRAFLVWAPNPSIGWCFEIG